MISRYTRAAMARVFAEDTRFAHWLAVEIALVEALEEAGIAPRGAAATIRTTAVLDLERIVAIEETVHHDVIAFLTQIGEGLGDEKRWLHFGITSSDLVDTAQALQLRDAGRLIVDGVRGLRAVCRRRADEWRDLPTIGRSHGIHGEPTSFGLKPLLWYAELERQERRLTAALDDLAVGQMSGAVGSCAHLAPAIEAAALARLGLTAAPVSTQVLQRDRHAAFLAVLANLGGTLEKIAVEIRHLQRTEVLEAAEPFKAGQKGSSAMPHKRNPVDCERVSGLARLLRSYAMAGFENQALWHERDISHSSVERVIFPDACILADFMLAEITHVLDGLEIFPARVTANLELTGGLVYSQRVLLLLVERGMTREAAYALVQAHALAAWGDYERGGRGAGGEAPRSFLERLAADAAVAALVPRPDLAALFDPAYYLRHVPLLYDRVLGSPTQETQTR